ncbi:MAG: NUDIX hydrolase [Treponema sp.]|jgi:8-oxo-dGTP pyrophosphatase MutT (NUDIX family)|nr:NUDIX hydrolase [Treponema sp.]
MMEANHLIWTEESRRECFRSGLLSVRDTECRSPEGKTRIFTVIDCPDWVNVVPVTENSEGKKFLMVRQWRHGSREMSLEFPGGILEKGENPETGAARELEEETAYRAENLIRLGSLRPNPAIMSNTVHFFLAENLIPLAGQNLDEDEFVDAEFVPEDEVFRNLGDSPYVHSLTAAALALYFKRTIPPISSRA